MITLPRNPADAEGEGRGHFFLLLIALDKTRFSHYFNISFEGAVPPGYITSF
jgi:hypothetical protein